jgi:membrane protease YdiL (CAAX protease family)
MVAFQQRQVPASGFVSPGTSRTTMSWPTAVVLHLAPGAALLLFFLATVPVLRAAGLPPVWGLLVGTLLVMVPVELWLVVRSHSGTSRSRLSWSALGLRRLSRADLRPLLLTGAACLLLPGLVVWLEPLIRTELFGWLPNWFSAGLGGLASYPAAVQATTVVLWLISQVVVGPAVEEIYFRGWLLSRLPGSPFLACTVNAALFSLYHFWQPQAWLTIFLFALPLAVLTHTQRNATVAVVVHCAVNLIAFAVLVGGALQR